MSAFAYEEATQRRNLLAGLPVGAVDALLALLYTISDINDIHDDQSNDAGAM